MKQLSLVLSHLAAQLVALIQQRYRHPAVTHTNAHAQCVHVHVFVAALTNESQIINGMCTVAMTKSQKKT